MRSRSTIGRQAGLLTGVLAALVAASALPASAAAEIPDSLHDPANCERLTPGPGHVAFRCDDGVPDAGGTNPNPDGARAIRVPARYRGHVGLPPIAPDAARVPGADREGRIAIDASITLPGMRPGRRGYPLLVFMHGCCGGNKLSWQADSADAGGERWRYSDAWFAARGYVVLTHTARGFVNGEGRGSTGETEISSRSHEINDYQHLACQLVGAAARFSRVTGHRVRVDPQRVVVTGGSYGGGFTWLAATDPRWRCTPDTGAGGTRMRLAAVAPKYGWTDLLYSLVPTGMHSARRGELPSPRGCDSGPKGFSGSECPDGGAPVGMPKASIVTGLFATGTTGLPPEHHHTTFPAKIQQGFACLLGTYPPDESSPLCRETLRRLLPEFLRERSAYYQNHFFRRLRKNPRRVRVPIFSAAAFTDPLFTTIEHRRMTTRLRMADRRYPIQTYHGDYQHFVQNKEREWVDICTDGGDRRGERRVCSSDDYVRGFDRRVPNRVRIGVTTRLNRFIDRFARPPRVRRTRRPRFDVTASVQICPQNEPTFRFPADEPGRRFRAPTFERLAPHTLRLELDGTQTTLSTAIPNPHAMTADPVTNERINERRCPVETEPAGPGVATYTSDPLPAGRTMIGATRVDARFSAAGTEGVQLNARLYEVQPDGTAIMADRGVRRVRASEAQAGRVRFELHGNGWRFRAGHRVRIELAQDDSPYVQRSTIPSSLTIDEVTLRIPVRERG